MIFFSLKILQQTNDSDNDQTSCVEKEIKTVNEPQLKPSFYHRSAVHVEKCRKLFESCLRYSKWIITRLYRKKQQKQNFKKTSQKQIP